MKKLVLAAAATVALMPAANAADLAARTYTKAPVAPVAAVYDWTGFYIGGHIGGGWGDIRSTELAPGTNAFPTGTAFTAHHPSGFLGGVQGGYNWQASNNFVLGIEGEYTWSDLSGTSSTVSTVNGFVSTTTNKINDIAMVTGRLGYAAGNWLLYAKGGGAWGQGNSRGTGFLANGTLFETTSSSADRSGWVAGAGVEWGFAPNWSAKIEYNHIDFGSTNVAINTSRATTNFVRSSETIDLVKAGVNYRFNWGGSTVARY
ncbi:outer membrane protein [Nitrobacter sp.]|uniref:outer membrane protein n=1 Tax=Nitrobacter sp. TaxID=29420 RepID=UPI003F651E78